MELTGLPPVSAPLPWQAADWSNITRQLDKARLPHALLLAGPQHTGKSQLALVLARLLLCSEPDKGLNCGNCHACVLSAGGTHGDFRWLQPEAKSRVIKVDQVRSVVDFSNKTAALGRRKVVVLAPADSMNRNAANSLLKCLEEPAPDTYLVLVCHRLQGVPPTVRSRCQLLKSGVPDAAQCMPWLDKVTGARPNSEELLKLADGRPLLARQLYQEGNGEALGELRRGLQATLLGQPVTPGFQSVLNEVSVDDFLEHLAAELRHLLRSLPAEHLKGAPARAGFILMDELARLQRAVDAGANPNRQLLVESMLAKVHLELGPARLGGNIMQC